MLPDWPLKVLENRSLLLWDAFVGVRPVEGMDLGFHRHQSNFLPISATAARILVTGRLLVFKNH